MECSSGCTKKEWRLCNKGGYDQRIIITFAILTIVALASGIVAIIFSEGVYLRAVLTFVFGGALSVSLRSLVAELIQYFRKNKPKTRGCSLEAAPTVKSKES